MAASSRQSHEAQRIRSPPPSRLPMPCRCPCPFGCHSRRNLHFRVPLPLRFCRQPQSCQATLSAETLPQTLQLINRKRRTMVLVQSETTVSLAQCFQSTAPGRSPPRHSQPQSAPWFGGNFNHLFNLQKSACPSRPSTFRLTHFVCCTCKGMAN